MSELAPTSSEGGGGRCDSPMAMMRIAITDLDEPGGDDGVLLVRGTSSAGIMGTGAGGTGERAVAGSCGGFEAGRGGMSAGLELGRPGANAGLELGRGAVSDGLEAGRGTVSDGLEPERGGAGGSTGSEGKRALEAASSGTEFARRRGIGGG